ncbi:uncharacterized protein N7515_002802 [Penicillium bovifimosum]|uniref:Retrovirus-related Pol polyprotein from transposon TNT 1-94-like beta-barrel domain-containing protein n=1 Tax=Penicillium bovifimosum TaxID=126998 RepID=A0A9W9L8E8_9EURO|nr:uncharacterized protein N7515_002802 [Penicillium bovifimosum]KAJ5144015.1 hypothetical protein N7515_002802 [Penicillium bovifimosum]
MSSLAVATGDNLTKQFEDNLKKLSADEEQEVKKFMAEHPEKTAQLTIADSDNTATESISFLTVSSYVLNTAAGHSLQSCWILDSGANTHITNRRDHFESYERDRRKVTLGAGKSIAEGRYGLYLLDEVEAPFNFAAVKTSPRPGVSIATPKTWHRRVGHLYEIWRLALVV